MYTHTQVKKKKPTYTSTLAKTQNTHKCTHTAQYPNTHSECTLHHLKFGRREEEEEEDEEEEGFL